MTIWDDRILEYIREEESGTPTELAESGYVRVSDAHVSRRCKRLVEHGLLRHLGNGVYVITDEGEAYLSEDYDAEAGMYIEDGAGQTNGPSATEDSTSST